MAERDAPEAQLERAVSLARSVLGENLLAVYLHGSAAAGALRPDSDLDLLAVVSRSLAGEERRALIRGLLGISGRGDAAGRARPLEVSVVRADAVRPWRYPPALELQYGDWWRPALDAGEEPWASPNPDLTILIAAARAADRPLFGPPAAELLDPVPAADLIRSAIAGIDGLLADLETDTRNVLLTLARIWLTAATGAIVGKDVAARWAAERLPPDDADVIRQAGEAYASGAPDGWPSPLAEARRCAGTIVARIPRQQ